MFVCARTTSFAVSSSSPRLVAYLLVAGLPLSCRVDRMLRHSSATAIRVVAKVTLAVRITQQFQIGGQPWIQVVTCPVQAGGHVPLLPPSVVTEFDVGLTLAGFVEISAYCFAAEHFDCTIHKYSFMCAPLVLLLNIHVSKAICKENASCGRERCATQS